MDEDVIQRMAQSLLYADQGEVVETWVKAGISPEVTWLALKAAELLLHDRLSSASR